jgi:DNA-binding PadR family transcriptional regulator
MAAVEEISDSLLRLKEGSLHPALHRMEEAGWIRAAWKTKDNGRRKQFASEEARWVAVSGAMQRVLKLV